MTSAPEPGPASAAAGREGAVAIVGPAAPGLPTTLVLRGTIDLLVAPRLGAMVAVAASDGQLLVDASGVDRFDTTAWVGMAEACARVVEAGGAVRTTGLRWSQVLEVLAAAPVEQVAPLMAGIRILRSHPDGGLPATAQPGDADPSTPRVPHPRTPVEGGDPRRARAVRPAPTQAGTDHLMRDWTVSDRGSGRG